MGSPPILTDTRTLLNAQVPSSPQYLEFNYTGSQLTNPLEPLRTLPDCTGLSTIAEGGKSTASTDAQLLLDFKVIVLLLGGHTGIAVGAGMWKCATAANRKLSFVHGVYWCGCNYSSLVVEQKLLNFKVRLGWGCRGVCSQS